MSKKDTVFFCKDCGYETYSWLGKCPSCNAWNSFEETKIFSSKDGKKKFERTSETKKIIDIDIKSNKRLNTGFEELNRVLGSGLVEGSLVLFGGEPGIGKSTLILQISETLAKSGEVLYVSGEESENQIKMRADRLNVKNQNIYFCSETSISNLEDILQERKPKVCIIDSIQTMYEEKISSSTGSVSQVREITARLLNISKSLNITCIIIGHVTKDGIVAGPKILEHMVDAVVYIEGERFLNHRIVRCVKNRFGSTNEIGIFEMDKQGLREVKNLSEMFLSNSVNEPGCAICPLLEGNSVLLLEIQALSTHSYYNMPRRVVSGVDFNRLNMLIAIIEKKCNINLGTKDIYLNVVGGIKITETAADFSIVAAIISSYKECLINKESVFIGEVSLTGEIRSVTNIEKRIKECIKLGFKNIYGPKAQIIKYENENKMEDVKLYQIENIKEILTQLFK